MAQNFGIGIDVNSGNLRLSAAEVELFPGTIKDNICRMRSDLPDAKSIRRLYSPRYMTSSGHAERLRDGHGAQRGSAIGRAEAEIALARAFFADPALVCLGRAKFQPGSDREQALTDTLLRAKAKRVTSLITQRPAVLNAMDKLLILRNGRMEAFGPAAEILVRLVRPANARKLAPSCEGLVAPDQPREVEGAANKKEAAQ